MYNIYDATLYASRIMNAHYVDGQIDLSVEKHFKVSRSKHLCCNTKRKKYTRIEKSAK